MAVRTVTVYLTPQRYRSEHSMRMRQLFLVCFRSHMAAECVVVISGLQEDGFDSFEEVQTKIKEIDDR